MNECFLTRARFRAGAWRKWPCFLSCLPPAAIVSLIVYGRHWRVLGWMSRAFWFRYVWMSGHGFCIFLAAPLDCSCESNPGLVVSKYSQSGWFWSWLRFLLLTTHVLQALGFLLSFPLVAAPVKHRFGSVRKMSDAITRNWGDFEKMFQKNSPLFFRYL